MIVLTLLLVFISFSECANILYIAPFASKSHNIFLKPIGLELARRGHNVTVLTAYADPNPPVNYHEVLSDEIDIWQLNKDEKALNVFETAALSTEKFHEIIIWNKGPLYTERIFQSPSVKHFLANDQKFDVVIAEQFILEAFNILAHKYQAPLILVSTFGNSMKHNFVSRNPLQQATIIHEYLTLEDPKAFWGRLRNFYFSAYELVYWKYWYLPRHDELAKKFVPNLPQPVPSLYEIQQNAALTLYNSHFSFDAPAAYLPNIVEIGGLHLAKNVGKIPEDLQTILDSSTDGVVYVNFGTNVRSVDLPDDKRDALLNVFRKLKQTIMWKWEDDTIKNMPNNLVIRKWFPQKEILSHKNIKVFISHGGLIGTQEAIYHGVPIIGIPIYLDQYNNLLQVQELSMGKILKYQDINEQKLEYLLHEVLNNDSYGKTAKEVSKRFNDRPMTAMDTAMFWIEYVIRHKGAKFMENPALDISWIAYSMLDVYAFVLFMLFVVLTIPYLITKKLFTQNRREKALKNKKIK